MFFFPGDWADRGGDGNRNARKHVRTCAGGAVALTADGQDASISRKDHSRTAKGWVAAKLEPGGPQSLAPRVLGDGARKTRGFGGRVSVAE